MILAVETSTSVCGVALVSEGAIIAERFVNERNIHSEKLLPLIDELLTEHSSSGKNNAAIEAVAVSIGPGSFTGLRIGLSSAKGLCYALDIPLIAVPTLEALAINILQEGTKENAVIMPMIDARRNEAYTTVYKINNNALEEVEILEALTYEQCSARMKNYSRITICGDASEKFSAFIAFRNESCCPQIHLPAADFIQCRASSVGIIGEMMLKKGTVSNLASIEPLYLKEFYTTMQPQPIMVS